MRYLHLDGGPVWPDPDSTGDLEWSLRYGELTREQMLAAASVIAAYRRALGSTKPSPTNVGSLTGAEILKLRRKLHAAQKTDVSSHKPVEPGRSHSVRYTDLKVGDTVAVSYPDHHHYPSRPAKVLAVTAAGTVSVPDMPQETP